MACFGSDKSALHKARAIVDDVFRLVAPGSFYERPVPERHRVIFYIGHLEAFDLNLLRHALDIPSIDPRLDQLFAFGIDPAPGCLPADTADDWPAMEVVAEYCSRVRADIDLHWNNAPEQLRHTAIEHRLMHAETLAYMLHNFEYRHLVQPDGFCEDAATNGSLRREVCEVPDGIAVLGRKRGDGFGWDNEFPETEVDVPAFRMDRWKVTNGDYLEFVEAGAEIPFFWIEKEGEFFLRRMFDEVPLPLDWPVYVTQAEAASYAEWRQCRLPAEAEWHRAAEDARPQGNFDARRFDPERADAHPCSASRYGIADLFGNGWEWTSTLFRPFSGFEPFPFYPGYSANFFDDDHYVLKGASPRTDAVFTRRSFRNWFRRDYPYVFASFRCIHKQPSR